MSKLIRYRIYSIWMWPIVITFIVLSFFIFRWAPSEATPPSSVNHLIALAPLLAILCFLVRLFVTHHGGACFETLVILGLGVMLSMFLLPHIEASRAQVRWQMSRNKLRSIGTALHSYHGKYGSFPPVEMFDSAVNVKRDWQTILIDSLAGEIEKSDFQHQTSTDQEEEPNHYFAVVGENTAWSPDGRKVGLDDIADPSNTAVAIGIFDPETKSSFAQETKILFDDLDSGKISWEDEIAVYPYQQDRFSTMKPSANLLMADGTVRHYVGTPGPEKLRWLFDIREKEPIDMLIEPDRFRAYFQNATPESSQITSRMILYRVWQACLLMIVIATFLPRHSRAAKLIDKAEPIELPSC